MSRTLLVVRPEPGASATAARARARGWTAIKASLFVVTPLAWRPPDPAGFDALLLTSANALRHGGPGLARYAGLPIYAVGETTAEAARAAVFGHVIAAGGDVASLAERLRGDNRRAVLHPAGRDVRAFDERGLAVTRIPVYAAEEVACAPPGFIEALALSPIVLLHSPRAAAAFARRVDGKEAARENLAIVAISARALASAGRGWGASAVAAWPDDESLLDAAGELGARTAIR